MKRGWGTQSYKQFCLRFSNGQNAFLYDGFFFSMCGYRCMMLHFPRYIKIFPLLKTVILKQFEILLKMF